MIAPVHVVCACNAAYVMPMSVMLTSLVKNFGGDRELVLHVISNDASETDRQNVHESIRLVRPDLRQIRLQWHHLDPALTKGLPVPAGTHFSPETYARLFIATLLPDCDRVVYLDCDMVVLADVADLYDAGARNNSVVQAVHHVRNNKVSSPRGVFDYAELGIPPDTRYFSTGVLVINLARWREQNLTEKTITYLHQRGDRAFVDQGAMNAFLALDWSPLDLRWNASTDVLFPQFWRDAGYSEREWKTVRDHPYIVHFSSHNKPWKKRSHAPRYSYFFAYLQKTVFKNSIRHRPRVENIVGRRLYYQLWAGARRLLETLHLRRHQVSTHTT